MTPAERDEVRRIAAGVFACDPHEANTIGGLIKLCNAVLRYVPAGDATDTGVPHEWVAAYPHKARNLTHALHAAADAAEGD